MPEHPSARRMTLSGHVQGVGYRPFVYRLAHELGIRGWVKNATGAVEIHAEAMDDKLATFARDLIEQAPAIARPRLVWNEAVSHEGFDQFVILPSETNSEPDIHVPPDYFTCPDCLREMRDPANRRHAYPFINCTQCGPRYTLITALPYDRPNTSMAAFPLCPDCLAEYLDPTNRRFHAEPVACPICGPHLKFLVASGSPLAPFCLPLHGGGPGWECRSALRKQLLGVDRLSVSTCVLPAQQVTTDQPGDADPPHPHPPPSRGRGPDELALSAAIAWLRAGRIVAVKGVGGYHLMCDARSDTAVQALRLRKPRPSKPLAVLFPADGRMLAETVQLTPDATALLNSPARPIVLLALRAPGSTNSPLSRHIAPGLAEIACFLPYSPLHNLLLQGFGAPLVATSGNISGEPVLTDNDEAQSRLALIADAFLHHNRPIVRPADDPVFRFIAGRPRPIRLGRGGAPLELVLAAPLPEPVLALGSHMKNAICLAWGQRAVISPHIGELDTLRSLETLAQVAEDLQRLYQVRARRLLLDRHPGYGYRRWARDTGLPMTELLHHHAHAAALSGEFANSEDWIVFVWDGVGLGEDGSLWGGEALVGRPGHWRRRASLRSFRLPGGDKAGREPWRSAVALCWEQSAGDDLPEVLRQSLSPHVQLPLLRQAWQRGVNCPVSSAAGRVFDAAAALIRIAAVDSSTSCESQAARPNPSDQPGGASTLLGLCTRASFEGEGPMRLEALAARTTLASTTLASPAQPLTPDSNGIWRTDWSPLLALLTDEAFDPADRAFAFHQTMAHVLVDQAIQLRAETGVGQVGLTGGVFQNRLLSELASQALHEAGFQVSLPEQVPVNDAGIAFGQVVEFLAGHYV